MGMDRLRLEDVLYVDDYLAKPVELKVLRPVALTFSRDGTSTIERLRTGQTVRLLGIIPDRYLVKTRMSTGSAEGWILSSELEPLPESLVKEVEQKSAEAEKLKKAIDKGEVEVGMPQDAVLKILGAPKDKTVVQDAQGRFEQWTYTSYKTIPLCIPTTVVLSNGVVTTSPTTVYRKVPSGSQTIILKDQRVVRIESRQEDLKNFQIETRIPEKIRNR
jgi:hypothetical protein